MALFAAVLSLITPCMVSHTACRACKAAVEEGKRDTKKGRGGREGRTKRYLTDRSSDALSGVNYQLLGGEVACVDGGLRCEITPAVCCPRGVVWGQEQGSER